MTLISPECEHPMNRKIGLNIIAYNRLLDKPIQPGYVGKTKPARRRALRHS